MKITTGARLVICLEDEYGDRPAMYMASAFEAEEDERVFLIDAPIYREIQYPLNPGQTVSVMYFETSAFYSFKARVIERVKRGELFSLRMEQLSEPERTQRREDFRLPVLLNGTIFKDEEDLFGGPKKILRLPVRTVDVSGGGVALRTGAVFEVGESASVQLPLGRDGAMITLRTESRRCVRVEDSEPEWRYQIGLKFLFSSKAEKEAVVSQIFQLERESRKSR